MVVIPIDRVLEIGSDAEFDRLAMELFAHQSTACEPYREYISLLGINPADIKTIGQIPFLPIELFKTHHIYCGIQEPEITFTSSTTGSRSPSRHYMQSAENYTKTFHRAFLLFYGSPADLNIYALLPGYLEREGSSLIYMAKGLIEASREGGGGFYLNEYDRLISDMERDEGPKILFGVSYALWDLAEKHAPKLHNTTVMETGGMKGQREELPKEAFHALLCEAFGQSAIHSEYSMAELSSQAYSKGGGMFYAPPWMRILVRDVNDPCDFIPHGRVGGVNIIDLANLSSCAFIQTQDIGITHPDHSFEVLGRIDHSEIRGCNLLVI